MKMEKKDLETIKREVDTIIVNYLWYQSDCESLEQLKKDLEYGDITYEFYHNSAKSLNEDINDRLQWIDEIFYGDEEKMVRLMGWKEKRECLFSLLTKLVEYEKYDVEYITFQPQYFFETVEEYVDAYKKINSMLMIGDEGIHYDIKQNELIESFINRYFKIKF